jgi:hypothetical protein
MLLFMGKLLNGTLFPAFTELQATPPAANG